MKPRLVSRALARAVLASLAPVILSTGCVAGDPCQPVSNEPVTGVNAGCEESFATLGPQVCQQEKPASFTQERCRELCPPNAAGMEVFSCSASQGQLICDYAVCGTGRRPEGLLANAVDRSRGVLASFLAGVAQLEAASVIAFENLARQLEGHRAPKRLVVAARRAARDEVRHARVTRSLAVRAGARVPRVRVRPIGARPLEAMAIENAIEGCVRETFGAAVALRQAEAAADAEVRREMRSIARDEARHADLSWQLARWFDGQLDRAARRRVRAARDRAVAALVREASIQPAPELVVALGLPRAVEAQAALAELRATIWS
jgi:hypothetical protein